MATPVWACGFECGTIGSIPPRPHWAASNTNFAAESIVTTDPRTDTYHLRINNSAQAGACEPPNNIAASNTWVIRFYLKLISEPGSTHGICLVRIGGTPGGTDTTGTACGAYYNPTDNKIYAGVAGSLGATGVEIATNTWYRIDVIVNASANPWTIDVQVDGVACGQATNAVAINTASVFQFGDKAVAVTDEYYIDDVLVSHTSTDYPLGAGYIKSYIPNADGSHNVAGANDFERSLTGTDITNLTTDAWQLVDDKPLPTSAVDFINGVAPPNATDYVEIAYADSVEPGVPRAVEAIVAYHDASGAGTNNFSVTLRDSSGGTTADIMAAATRNVGATITFARKMFGTIPGAGAWTKAAFNALRSRFLVSDASPDPYIDSLMLEVEFQPALYDHSWGRPYGQQGQRQMQQLLAT